MSKTRKTKTCGQTSLPISENITCRPLQGEFIARGLASRDLARETGVYANADAVLGRLEKMLASAKAGK